MRNGPPIYQGRNGRYVVRCTCSKKLGIANAVLTIPLRHPRILDQDPAPQRIYREPENTIDFSWPAHAVTVTTYALEPHRPLPAGKDIISLLCHRCHRRWTGTQEELAALVTAQRHNSHVILNTEITPAAGS